MKQGSEKLNKRVMIIEDEIDLCYLLSATLKKSNLYSQCAHTINEAKETLQSMKPSLVFLDNNLSDGYGSDFISTVKQFLPKTKVIMITAHDSAADIKGAYSKGADYFISKPFSTTSILTALNSVQAANR